MSKKLAVIGVGNMAKAIIAGIRASKVSLSTLYLYDVNSDQYKGVPGDDIVYANSIEEAVSSSDYVLISVSIPPRPLPSMSTTVSIPTTA